MCILKSYFFKRAPMLVLCCFTFQLVAGGNHSETELKPLMQNTSYYKKSPEKIKEDLVILGFSKRGNCAYIKKEYNHPQNRFYFSLIIQNLVTDKIIFKTHEYNLKFSQVKTLNEFFSQNKVKIKSIAEKFNIELSFKNKVYHFPFFHEDKTISVSFAKFQYYNKTRFQKRPYRVFIHKGIHSKKVGVLYSFTRPVKALFVKSPFENRGVIAVSWQDFLPDKSFIKKISLMGCHLNAGFGKNIDETLENIYKKHGYLYNNRQMVPRINSKPVYDFIEYLRIKNINNISEIFTISEFPLGINFNGKKYHTLTSSDKEQLKKALRYFVSLPRLRFHGSRVLAGDEPEIYRKYSSLLSRVQGSGSLYFLKNSKKVLVGFAIKSILYRPYRVGSYIIQRDYRVVVTGILYKKL